jgi:hypothetical protein
MAGYYDNALMQEEQEPVQTSFPQRGPAGEL